LNVTAISAVNNASVLECWELTNPPRTFRGAANYDIGSFANAYIGVIAPKTYIGKAYAPSPQYSLFLSGLAHISIPNSTLPASQSEVWVQGGKYGTIIAVDTTAVSIGGHITEFPGGDDTVIAQFPFVDEKLPEHKVLYRGPC
ncbi:hypothetical protein EJ08DRAFT_567761, partial [Tothia fuscella]